MAELTRILIVFIAQSFIFILFLILAFKVLIKKRNRASITLASFYILLDLGLLSNMIFIILTPSDEFVLLTVFYYLALYFIIFPIIFILIFINIMLKLEEVFTIKKIIILILTYGILCALLFLIPNGITFSIDWYALYSIPFSLSLMTLITLFIIIPTIFYSFKLYKSFKAKDLKKKLRYFLTGVVLLFIILYGAIIFNSSLNDLYRTVWVNLAFFLEIMGGFLIYYGLGREL